MANQSVESCSLATRQQLTLPLSARPSRSVPATRMASAPSSPPHEQEDALGASAVCCMCGDHGLQRELVRCKSCRVRLQHSYCSDLYPRATAYTRCNWCLREPAPAQQGGGAAAGYVIAAEMKRKVAMTTLPSDYDDDTDERRLHRHAAGCYSSRRAPPGSYPVKKKQRKADRDESAPAPADTGVKGSCTGTGKAGDNSKTEELMRAGKVRARAKVRRYKLLAEVISC